MLEIRSHKYLAFILTFVIILAVVVGVTSLLLATNEDFYFMFCVCEQIEAVGNLATIIVKAIILVAEVANFTYFNLMLFRQKVKTKYWIREELVGVSILWITMRIFFFVVVVLEETDLRPHSLTFYMVA